MVGTTPTIRFYLSLYLFVAAVYLLSASGRLGISDGYAMFNVAQSIVSERSLSSEPCDPQLPGKLDIDHGPVCLPGVDGRYYAGYGLVPSLAAVPAVLGGKLVAALLHVNGSVVSKVMVSVLTTLVAALACVVLAMWIVKLGYGRRTAMLGACILAFASPFWHFGVKGFYSEPYFTLALLLAAYLLSAPRLPLAVSCSGLAFGIACGCRMNGMILFPVFILFLAVHVRARGLTVAQFLREAALFTMSFSVCVVLIGWANYARFGSPLKTGYPSLSAMLSNPLFHGMAGLLFNGRVGLLIFVPWVLLVLICFPSFVRTHLPESVLCGALFLSNLLFFAKFEVWSGGWVAGPRYLTPTLPFLVLAMVPWIDRFQHRAAVEPEARTGAVVHAVAIILLLVGVAIQSVGVLYPETRYYVLMTYYGDTRAKPWWAGSIPLASIDFVPRVARASAPSIRRSASTDRDQLTFEREQARAFAAMSTVNTEEDFLQSFPNSENLMLPNMMLFKMGLLGLPALTVYAYGSCIIVVGLMGLAGLKRYAAPDWRFASPAIAAG